MVRTGVVRTVRMGVVRTGRGLPVRELHGATSRVC